MASRYRRPGQGIGLMFIVVAACLYIGKPLEVSARIVWWFFLGAGVIGIVSGLFEIYRKGRQNIRIVQNVSAKQRRAKFVALNVLIFFFILYIVAPLIASRLAEHGFDWLFGSEILWYWMIGQLNPKYLRAAHYGAYGGLTLAVLLAIPNAEWWQLFGLFAKVARPFRHWRGIGGGGGAGKWAGLLDEVETRYRPGALWLGTSCYSSALKIGLDDNRHFVTIAGTRGGKGRSAIIPTLLTYPGSVIVTDPKGENAAITARKRRQMGQAVHIIDPFGIVPGVTTARFNPLAALDLSSPRIKEDIDAIADGLVVQESGTGQHFSESSRIIIAGFIAHLLSREPPERRTLPFMLNLMTDNPRREAALDDMSRNPSAGGLPMSAFSILGEAGDRAFGDYMSTLTRNLSWIGSKPMAHVLEGSDFSLANLKRRPMTVYLCLQERDLVEHRRLLRVMVNMAADAVGADLVQPRHAVLFLLDEFHVLGRMEKVKTGSVLMAGSGLKLWIVLQSLGQLSASFPDDWETMLDTAAAVQLFSLGVDRETPLWASQSLGRYPLLRREERFNPESGRMETVTLAEGIADLAAPDEVRALTQRDRMTQIVVRPGLSTLYLRRANYDQHRLFRGAFDPRPGERAGFEGPRYVEPPRPSGTWQRRRRHQEQSHQQEDRQQRERQQRQADSGGVDPYKEALEIFGLADGFTMEQLKARYRDLQKRVHPDVGGSAFFAKKLNAAYEILKARCRA